MDSTAASPSLQTERLAGWLAGASNDNSSGSALTGARRHTPPPARQTATSAADHRSGQCGPRGVRLLRGENATAQEHKPCEYRAERKSRKSGVEGADIVKMIIDGLCYKSLPEVEDLKA